MWVLSLFPGQSLFSEKNSLISMVICHKIAIFEVRLEDTCTRSEKY